MEWIKAPKHLSDFNGLRWTIKRGEFEWGIFREKYGHAGMYWSLRRRPLGPDGEAVDCWNHGCPVRSMREGKERFGIVADIARAQGGAL